MYGSKFSENYDDVFNMRTAVYIAHISVWFNRLAAYVTLPISPGITKFPH